MARTGGLTSACVHPTNAPTCFTRISLAVASRDISGRKSVIYHLSTGWETGRQRGHGITLVTEISDRSRLGGNDRVAISLPFTEWPPSAAVHSWPSPRTIPHPAGSTEDVKPNDSYTAFETQIILLLLLLLLLQPLCSSYRAYASHIQ